MFKVYSVFLQSDSVEPIVLKVISDSRSKAIDTVKNLYYPFTKTRDNVIVYIQGEN